MTAKRSPSAASLVAALAAKGCNVTVELPDGTIIKALTPAASALTNTANEEEVPIRYVPTKKLRQPPRL